MPHSYTTTRPASDITFHSEDRFTISHHQEREAAVYIPALGWPNNWAHVLVRTHDDLNFLIHDLRKAMQHQCKYLSGRRLELRKGTMENGVMRIDDRPGAIHQHDSSGLPDDFTVSKDWCII